MWRATRVQVLRLVFGLVLFGVGIALMVRAELGVSSWDVLALGLMNATGLDYAPITLIIGVVVFALWLPLRQRPGLGTVANLVLIPLVAQAVLWLLPEGQPLWGRVLLLAGGIVLIAIGSGFYIGAQLGPGPRDGLMTGLHERTRWPIWLVRTLLEVTVVAVGWALGGNFGVGTIVFALVIGPLVDIALRLFSVPVAPVPAEREELGVPVADAEFPRDARRQ